MTAPRIRPPRRVYHVIRRVMGQRFRLTPTENVALILLYCLARAAEKYGVEIHAFCFSVNHLHLLLSDVRGGLSLGEFMCWFGFNSARALNRLQGLEGSLWESNVPYTSVEIHDEERFFDTLGYILSNPVKDGMVRRHHSWGAMLSKLSELLRSKTCRRPKVGFRSKGEDLQPARVPLKLTKPEHLLPGVSDQVYRQRAKEALDRHERAARAKHQGAFLGLDRARRLPPTAAPRTLTSHKTLDLPALVDDERLRKKLRRELRVWRAKYRAAWLRYKADTTDPLAIFLAGAVMWVHRFGAPVEPDPD